MTPRHHSRWRRATRLILVLVVGAVAVTGLALVAADAEEANERSLLEQRANEATTTLQTVLPLLQIPLFSAASVVAESDAAAESFERVVGSFVTDAGLIQSATLWAMEPGGPRAVHTIGKEPRLAEVPVDEQEALLDAAPGEGVTMVDLTEADERALGFALAVEEGGTRYVVYLESPLPDDPTTLDLTGDAFDDLDYAVYLGARSDPEQLLLSTTRDLPLEGDLIETSIPFGDGSLLVVLGPREQLGDPLLRALPWLIAVVGAVLIAAFALLTQRVQSAGARAAQLAEENAALAQEQQAVAKTLQQGLLPQTLGVHPQVSAAQRYQAGVEGIEIGGDWYDAVVVDGRVVLTVGDVSGRGLPAASVMATMRLAIRAYAAQGDEPGQILTRLNALLDVRADGHFATVLCAAVDLATLELVAATAGHPPPVLLDPHGAVALAMRPGLPIGVASRPSYAEHRTTLAPSTTVVAFTDGLYERRGEPVDVGLERVRACVSSLAGRDPDEVVDAVIAELKAWESADDTAVLAMRFEGPSGTAGTAGTAAPAATTGPRAPVG